ncbi:MAG: glycosyltransferase [Verrucomicrobiota bacterium]|jgi:glycosyltransferase involved in cell wall biosynthesis
MSCLTHLFISGFLPSPRIPSGGQKLVYEILREQAAQGPVTLLAFSNELERGYFVADDYGMCAGVKVFELTRAVRLRSALRHPGLPLTTSARYAAASHWLRGRQFASVWVEFIQGASLLAAVPSGVPSTLVIHDLFHQTLGRRAAGARGIRRWLWHWEAARTRRWEGAVIRQAGRVLTLNDKDRELILECSGRTDVTVRYPVVDAAYRRVCRSAASVRPDTILFWGLMSRAENEDSVTWFCREVLPGIRRVRPGVRFLIAGANPSPAVRALAGPGIEVLGFVKDPIPLFGSVALAVAPLRQGAGIKIKVIEYLAAGIPTVASPVGAEGVRPSPLLRVRADAAGFASACLDILGQTLHDVPVTGGGPETGGRSSL